MMSGTELLWNFVAERHRIYLRRKAGEPRPWTKDPVLQQYRFCNMYRELDKTTLWFAEHVRNPVIAANPADVLLATVLFRWFNRITTGEAIFLQQTLIDNQTTWAARLAAETPTEWTAWLRTTISAYCGSGPYVTGAYIIKTPDGMNKLTGVLWCVEQFMTRSADIEPKSPLDAGELSRYLKRTHGEKVTLAMVWNWLCQFPYLGSFMAAQIIADVKYTPLLNLAPDWQTWAASGPGSRKGLNIVVGRSPDKSWREPEWHAALLELREALLPHFKTEGWPLPHAQDVQNMCCEFAKYTRGSSRQIFR